MKQSEVTALIKKMSEEYSAKLNVSDLGIKVRKSAVKDLSAGFAIGAREMVNTLFAHHMIDLDNG